MVIIFEDDLDLAKIAESGQCFRWTADEDGAFRIIHGAKSLYALDMGLGRFRFECDQEAFDATWQDYLDLSEDYRAIRARIDPETDPFLWRAAKHEQGIRILRQDAWETLVSFIISQNRNIPAIRRSIELLCEIAGNERMDSRNRPYYAFPSPEDIYNLDESALKQCALGYRCKYVHAAAKAVLEGSIDFEALKEADESEAISSLTKLYGVGVKVASCVSLFGLHHLNTFPIDVWIGKVLKNEYPEGFPFEQYNPYNGVYQQYLFAYYRALAV